MYKLYFTKQAQKDAQKIKQSGLKDKVEDLLGKLQINPFIRPPSYEKLVGDLTGSYSRRITIQYRLVYQVYEDQKAIKIIRMWTHYE